MNGDELLIWKGEVNATVREIDSRLTRIENSCNGCKLNVDTKIDTIHRRINEINGRLWWLTGASVVVGTILATAMAVVLHKALGG